MARPPRGRLPGTGRTSDETGVDELPLELPRVDPIRPRVQRPPRTEPKLDATPEEPAVENGPRRFVPPLRAAIPNPPASPRRMTPEQVDNPFDYYAMPKSESDTHSRPIVKPAAPAAEKPEFLTSKYYTPRRDLTAQRDFNDSDDQTANWARSVRPGRPILEPTMPQDEDDTPVHLRHLPSRVRDHLRAEPKMPQASETLGSFAHSAPTTTQVRTRSGVPLPLAPELRASAPQDVRVTRQIPDLPMPSFVDQPAHDDQQDYDEQQIGEDRYDAPLQTPQVLEAQLVDAFHDNARDDFAHEPEFDSQSDEAVTGYDPRVAPLMDNVSADEMARYALPDAESLSHDRNRDDSTSTQINPQRDLPTWMRRTDEPVPPPPVAVSDWDQDEALHALTSRIRNRAVEKMDRFNKPRAGFLKSKLIGAVGQFGATIRDKARDVQNARAQVKARLQPQVKLDFRDAPELRDDTNIELRAIRDVEPVPSFDPLPIAPPDFSRADDDHIKAPRRSWFFFSRTPRVPVARVSVETNRSVRRKRQSRLYEDIVAWIVVPPFIIGAIYGGLELAKFLSNSPLGKFLSGD